MADFTSALYLGLAHAHADLRPWKSLTLGAPAALREPEEASRLASQVASLAGLGGGALWPSTLHLFWDLFSALAGPGTPVLFDKGAYPVARWGAAAAEARGAVVRWFSHLDGASLGRALEAHREGPRPIVVTDGFCPGCGRSAPLRDYLREVESASGLLVVDDTQAAGVLGSRPRPSAPFGEGGGGSLRRQGVDSEYILWIASLAKGLGAPVAVLASTPELVLRVRRRAPTTVHTSPPSAAAIAALRNALAVCAVEGGERRARLSRNVRALREVLISKGLSPAGGAFPVQRIGLGADAATERLQGALWRRGVRAALVRSRCLARTEIAFLVTAAHAEGDMNDVAAALSDVERRWIDVDDGGWSSVAGAGVPAAEMG